MRNGCCRVTLVRRDLHVPWHPRVLLVCLFAFGYCSLSRWYGGGGSLNRPSLASDAIKVENEVAETRIFSGKLDI